MVTIGDIMAVIQPHVSTARRHLKALPSKSISRIKQSGRKPVNAKGFRVPLYTRDNVQYGGAGEGANLLTGGDYKTAELAIGTVNFNMALKLQGGAVRNMKDAKYSGMSLGDMMMRDNKKQLEQMNVNFCLGDGLFRRGTVSSFSFSSPYTTVTFDSGSGGSYYIDEGASYFIHHPTTYALHGGAAAFVCYDKPTATTARFVGDMTAATTIAANDILIPKGTADGESSLNRAVRGPSYFCAVTGDYFGLDKDVETRAQGIRHDAGDDFISPELLDAIEGLYQFKWGEDSGEVLARHTDFMSPTQDKAYLLNVYPLLRLDQQTYKNADLKAGSQGHGGRQKVVDNHYQDDVWFTLLTESIFEYVLEDFDVWKLDGQEARTVYANSSITDVKQIHYFGSNQYGDEFPGKQIEIHNLGTAGLPTKTGIA
jgi:hypothetical protein